MLQGSLPSSSSLPAWFSASSAFCNFVVATFCLTVRVFNWLSCEKKQQPKSTKSKQNKNKISLKLQKTQPAHSTRSVTLTTLSQPAATDHTGFSCKPHLPWVPSHKLSMQPPVVLSRFSLLNQCDIDTVVEVVHRKWSDKHCKHQIQGHLYHYQSAASNHPAPLPVRKTLRHTRSPSVCAGVLCFFR